jgi:aspartate kinase
MALIVQKFGGTSVGDTERIRRVAKRVVDTAKAGNQVVVVVSAMAGQTDRLIGLAREMTDDPDPREYDALVSTGEQQTTALLAMAIQGHGVAARSFTGVQARVLTDDSHSRARIHSIDAEALRVAVGNDAVAVVAGFQGHDGSGNVTTFGRGGSDTSAVAIAAALDADTCEIYTDVPGVFTADPNVVPRARKLDRVSYDEMLEMASLGAKVLQIRSVKFGKRYGVPIHVRSTFSDEEGTWVVPESEVMERLVVSGVTYNRNEAEIRVFGVRDEPGAAAKIFGPMSEAGVVVDVIPIAERVAEELDAGGVTSDDSIAKVSVVGLGMRDHAGVASRMFRRLHAEGINIQMINTSEIKISVVIAEKYTELACRTLHSEFELDADQVPAEEAF